MDRATNVVLHVLFVKLLVILGTHQYQLLQVLINILLHLALALSLG